jgi:predicted GNAT family acetyltransferase
VSASPIVRSLRSTVTLTDKTGAPVTITQEPRQFTIGLEGNTVGRLDFADRDGQRVFYHTEVDEAFGGRGLATVLIAEALSTTRTQGLRIVPVCPTVAAYVKKHHDDFDGAVDLPTPDIMAWLDH